MSELKIPFQTCLKKKILCLVSDIFFNSVKFLNAHVHFTPH